MTHARTHSSKKASTIAALITALVIGATFIAWVTRDTSSVIVSGAGVATSQASGEYSYDKTGLSFSRMQGYSIRLSADQGIDTIIIQSDADASQGLQISVLPFDESPESLTFDKIKKDLPDLNIGKPQTGVLPFGSNALSFETGKGDFRTREVWFVHKAHLYQMSAPVASSGLIEPLIGTMEFK